MNMAKTYKDLRDKVRRNRERAAPVKTRRQAMEDALALAADADRHGQRLVPAGRHNLA